MTAQAKEDRPRSLAPSTVKALDREWGLFADWCLSWDAHPLEADADVVARFLAAFPAALSTNALRVRAIRHRFQAAGVPLALPGLYRAPDTLWRSEPGLVGVGEAISQLPRYRFPVGLRGRRDAFVLLAASLGLTREQIHQLSANDVHVGAGGGPAGRDGGGVSGGRVTVAGHDVTVGPDPGSCQRCVVVRWLVVLGSAWAGDRGHVRDLLDVTCAIPERHDCDTAPGTGWDRAEHLLVSLDTHGWVRPGVGVSTRTITGIISAHRHRTGMREQIPAPRPGTGTAVVSGGDLREAQEDLDQRIAALLLRTTEALAEAADIHAHLTGRNGDS